MTRLQKLEQLFPVLMRYGGLAGGLIFVPLVWLLTDRLAPELIAFFTTIMGIGVGQDALRDFARSRPQPPSSVAPLVAPEDEAS